MADVNSIAEIRLGDGTNGALKAKVDSNGNQYNVITNTAAVSGNVGVTSLPPIAITNTSFNVGNFPTVGATSGNPLFEQLVGPGTSAISPLYVNTVAGSGGAGTSAGNPLFEQLVAGSAAIGSVTVTALPILPSGTNVIGHVIADAGSTTAVTALPSLIAGSAIVGKFGIDQTTPGTTNGVYISQVTPGTSNGVQINGGPGTTAINPIFVSSETDSNLVIKSSPQLTSAALAAGASVTLFAPFVTATKQGVLKHVDVSSSVPIKVELQSVNNASAATSVITRFTSAYTSWTEWREYVTGEFLGVTGADGTHACFAVKITNEDPQGQAADVYASVCWSEQ